MKRPKPKPGSLPFKKPPRRRPDEPGATDAGPLPPTDPPPWALTTAEAIQAAQSAIPPFLAEEPPQPKPPSALTKLQAARRKADQLADAARDEAFDDWVRRCLKTAERPDEWSPARALYESYLRHVGRYGSSRSARSLSRQVAATETRFGKMLGSLFHKSRRARGWFYPVRLKKGA